MPQDSLHYSGNLPDGRPFSFDWPSATPPTSDQLDAIIEETMGHAAGPSKPAARGGFAPMTGTLPPPGGAPGYAPIHPPIPPTAPTRQAPPLTGILGASPLDMFQHAGPLPAATPQPVFKQQPGTRAPATQQQSIASALVGGKPGALMKALDAASQQNRAAAAARTLAEAKILRTGDPSLTGMEGAVNPPGATFQVPESNFQAQSLVRAGMDPTASAERALGGLATGAFAPGSLEHLAPRDRSAVMEGIGNAIPRAAAVAAISNPASIASAVAEAAGWNLLGGVPSKPEDWAVVGLTMGLMHNLGPMMKRLIPDLKIDTLKAINSLDLTNAKAKNALESAASKGAPAVESLVSEFRAPTGKAGISEGARQGLESAGKTAPTTGANLGEHLQQSIDTLGAKPPAKPAGSTLPVRQDAALPANKPTMYLSYGGKRYEIASFEDAASRMREANNASVDSGLGPLPHGRIEDASGNHIGTISTNGRVWPPGEWTAQTKPIYDPYAKPATAPPAAAVPAPKTPGGGEIHPELHFMGGNPDQVHGGRWTNDRGAMPGEPFSFLDGNSDTAKAVIVEQAVNNGDYAYYEAFDAQGNSLGRFSTADAAARSAEHQIDSAHAAEPPAPTVPAAKRTPDHVAQHNRLERVMTVGDSTHPTRLRRIMRSADIETQQSSLDALADQAISPENYSGMTTPDQINKALQSYLDHLNAASPEASGGHSKGYDWQSLVEQGADPALVKQVEGFKADNPPSAPPSAPETKPTPAPVSEAAPKPETPAVPPGTPPEAKPAAPAPEMGTGISKASREQMAQVLGTRSPTEIGGESHTALYEKGLADHLAGNIDPERQIADLASGGRPATDRQVGAFAAFRDLLIGDLKRLNAELDGTLTGAERETALAKRDLLYERIAAFDRNLDEVKAANGRSLSAFQIGQTVNWDDLESVKIEARRLKGPALTDKEIKAVEDAHAEIAKMAAAHEKAIADLEAEKATEGAVRMAGTRARGGSAAMVRAQRAASAERIKELFAKSTSTLGSGAGALQGLIENAPELARELRNYIELTIRELGLRVLDSKFYDSIRSEIETLRLKDAEGNKIDFSDSDIRQVFAKYYETTTRTPGAAAKNLADLRKQADLFEQIQMAKEGEIKAKGAPPPPPSEEVAKLRLQLNQVLRAMAASPGQDAARTRLHGILAQAEDMLGVGYRKIRPAKPPTASDVAALKIRIAQVRKTMRIEDQIAGLENQIDSGQFKGPAKRVEVRNSQIDLLQIKLDAARNRAKATALNMRPQSAVRKIEGFGRNIQLLNHVARIVDLTANTVKMGAYVATNPARALMSDLAFGKTAGAEGHLLFSPSRWKRIMGGATERIGAELGEIWHGADIDALEKFGRSGGLGTKLAGATDAPFKDFYRRVALDDYALGYGKARGLKGEALANFRVDAFKQLAGSDIVKGPLTGAEAKIALIDAHDWALRQTFNVDNRLSQLIKGSKRGIGEDIKKAHPAAADALSAFIDMNVRFTKVIFNVALERANYHTVGPVPLGTLEAAVRYASARYGGKVAPGDARLIVDLAVKGLTGLAVFKMGQSAWKKDGYLQALVDRGLLKGEIAKTKGGSRFVRWTLAPNVAGGLDANQIGSVFSPLLMGATYQMIQDSGLTEAQKAQLWWNYQMGETVSTPLASGLNDMLATLSGQRTVGRYVGGLVGRNLIPGAVRDTAERMDTARTGVRLRSSQSFWDEIAKRIPRLRENLPANEKNATVSAFAPYIPR